MWPDYADRHFLVLGLGESGLAMAQWLGRGGARVRVADSRVTPPGAEALRAKCPYAELICGEFSSELLDGVDTLALSPGLSINLPLLTEARQRGIVVTGEIDIFAQALQKMGLRQHCKLLAITGTNGKTTTTTLVGALVLAAGIKGAVAGNISPSALDELMRRLDGECIPQVWVLELSSFQMETTSRLQADAAAVLNVTDDHLDRHGSMAQYASEKARIFEGSGVQVLNRQDVYSFAMQEAGRQVVSFGLDLPPSERDFGVREINGLRWMVHGNEPLLPCAELSMAGDHSIANALAALALCVAIDLPLAPMLDELRRFRGLPHRVERVAQRDDGVVFFDDSKGTNVGATIAAMQGLGRKLVLIAGGDGKGQDFSPLAEVFKAHARAVVLIGKDAQKIQRETASSGVPFFHAENMDFAVNAANELAQTGDAVLLSPACASFDMYKNYAQRAEYFILAVRKLPGIVVP